MTVAELIELLKTFPQQAQIVSYGDLSNISIVNKQDVVYSDNEGVKLDGDFIPPRSFQDYAFNQDYVSPYVEISGG